MTAELEFFATDEAVAGLETALVQAKSSTDAAQRLQALSALAWQLRQRDTPRALALTAEVEQHLANAAQTLPPAEHSRLDARGKLIRGEAKWLHGELDAASDLADQALRIFTALSDALGCADAHWLLSAAALDRGDGVRDDAELQAMDAAAAQRDPVRSTLAQAAQATGAAFRDLATAKQQWAPRFAQGTDGMHPAAACWVESFLALTADLECDHARAILHWSKAYDLALGCGQIRRAVIAAANTGDSFNYLNDYHAALEWVQRGLDLPSAAAWPGAMGVALLQTAETLRLMERHDAAADMLHEAQALLAPMTASRSYALTLQYLGDLEFDRRHYASSLETFRQYEQRAIALDQTDLLADALCGQSKAYLELGQPEAALKAALAALAAPRSDASSQMRILRVLADIHARDADHALPLPPGMQAASAPLHYLQRALDAAASIDHYTVPGDLLDALAQEYAKAGDLVRAFELSKQANQSRERTHSTEASNRAIALEIRHETERTRAEADYNRQLAQSEARRAELLQDANATLENLGEIGRDITASLDMRSVFESLDRHVNRLLDASTFAVFLYDEAGPALQTALHVEAGQHLPTYRIQLDDPNAYVARCARERREIVLELDPEAAATLPGLIPNTQPTLSLMYAPLMASDRLLGVMTIQSPHPRAYGERETAILRTLCTYGAIALANGHAYDAAEKARRAAEQARADTARALEELGRAQAELEQKNKELETLSTTDRLTGLANRLRMETALAQELSRSDRHAHALSLILLDIDYFKRVNDTHGHHVGDAVLQEVARVLSQNIRKTDLLGRWGGEEFLILCLDTGAEAATVLAEKIRAALAAHDIPIAGRKTGSFGVCSYRAADDIKSMMIRADAALYRAKESGRNRVEVG
ncbi:MAG: GGDEF domain-containing protein [Betaproteobacteria bacterium]|nr:GGDEF domain-containing protein [Betaproteobacteria bacterium]